MYMLHIHICRQNPHVHEIIKAIKLKENNSNSNMGICLLVYVTYYIRGYQCSVTVCACLGEKLNVIVGF